MKTDATGKVSLGKLSDIVKIRAILQKTTEIDEFANSWTIGYEKGNKLNYPDLIRMCEGHDVVFPYQKISDAVK